MGIHGRSGSVRRCTARRLVTAALVVAAVLVGSLGTATSAQAWPTTFQQIVNYSSGKCLQPESFALNALVVQRTCSRFATLQAWEPVNEDADGYVWLRNFSTGKCMDLQVNSPEEVGNGTLIQIFFCDQVARGERWNRSFGSRASHFQIFTKERPTLCLDVTGRSSADGARLQLWSCKFFEDAQEFRFENR